MVKFNSLYRVLILLLMFHMPASASDQVIADYVNGLLNTFLSIAKDSKASEQDKVEKARTILEANLDFDWMGKFVLGRYRRDMQEGDLNNFLKTYKMYLTYTYADAVKQYKGEDVVIKNVHQLSDNEYVVKTAINKAGQDPFLIDYLVRHVDGASGGASYKIFDVVTEGVSMISSQQAEFGSVIGSGSIKALIDDLKQKIH